MHTYIAALVYWPGTAKEETYATTQFESPSNQEARQAALIWARPLMGDPQTTTLQVNRNGVGILSVPGVAINASRS